MSNRGVRAACTSPGKVNFVRFVWAVAAFVLATVMIGAGLLAKNAVERGLDVKPWVKTSMAPGSKVVTRYLEASGLIPYLEALNFHTVGYGCTT